jgi:PhzF family phenazine biosynthesis protein
MIMALTIFQVDAFTSEAFAGNPAAVCLLPEPRDAVWMQRVASEMNLSETAFLVRQEDGYDLRWFTPALEVDLCGHATLASAHILWETGELEAYETARFHTRSGLLTASRAKDRIEMDFPATPAFAVTAPAVLVRALQITPRFVGKNVADYLVEVDSEAAVLGIRPDFGLLRELGVRGVMVTSASETEAFDFVSRFFAPGAGIDEDPVTGSAHSCLGPYWGERLGKQEMVAYQASARGGTVHIRLAGDRVILGGQAVTVLRAELLAG